MDLTRTWCPNCLEDLPLPVGDYRVACACGQNYEVEVTGDGFTVEIVGPLGPLDAWPD